MFTQIHIDQMKIALLALKGELLQNGLRKKATLRNWQLNGLITVRRAENGYRIYDSYDIGRLKIIRTLHCAYYSLSAILRLLNSISNQVEVNIMKVLNRPNSNEDIISVCDKLLISIKKIRRVMLKQYVNDKQI